MIHVTTQAGLPLSLDKTSVTLRFEGSGSHHIPSRKGSVCHELLYKQYWDLFGVANPQFSCSFCGSKEKTWKGRAGVSSQHNLIPPYTSTLFPTDFLFTPLVHLFLCSIILPSLSLEFPSCFSLLIHCLSFRGNLNPVPSDFFRSGDSYPPFTVHKATLIQMHSV